MVVTEGFSSPDELAMFSTGKTSTILLIGSQQECEPLAIELERLIYPTEQIVHVRENDKLFDTLEKPNDYPAIGVWSAKGSLVGYREQQESLAEFLEYARRFC